jgi:hypothetical protein
LGRPSGSSRPTSEVEVYLVVIVILFHFMMLGLLNTGQLGGGIRGYVFIALELRRRSWRWGLRERSGFWGIVVFVEISEEIFFKVFLIRHDGRAKGLRSSASNCGNVAMMNREAPPRIPTCFPMGPKVGDAE